ncbi:MAG: hypothetical protein ABI321_15065 [Polyangia bacterium]
MTRVFALGLLLLVPALAIARPKHSKPAKKPAASPASNAPVEQAKDDEAPGSRQESAPKKK